MAGSKIHSRVNKSTSAVPRHVPHVHNTIYRCPTNHFKKHLKCFHRKGLESNMAKLEKSNFPIRKVLALEHLQYACVKFLGWIWQNSLYNFWNYSYVLKWTLAFLNGGLKGCLYSLFALCDMKLAIHIVRLSGEAYVFKNYILLIINKNWTWAFFVRKPFERMRKSNTIKNKLAETTSSSPDEPL